MSDTPRMDAAIDLCGDYEKPRQYAMRIERAGKKLERELNIALSQVDQQAAKIAELRDCLVREAVLREQTGGGYWQYTRDLLASTDSTWLATHDAEVRREVLEEAAAGVSPAEQPKAVWLASQVRDYLRRMAEQPKEK